MNDLRAVSGLPIALDGDRLVFEDSVVVEETKGRPLDELAPVALAPEACRGSREIAYYMYNGVYRRSDAPLLTSLPLRYELTLMPFRSIGCECIKTHGHVHSAEPESGLTYAEICEVLAGTAHFFFQELGAGGTSEDRAFYVEVGPGQKIIVPPGLDHLTINPGPGPLLFADVIARDCRTLYEGLRARHGAAYLEVCDGDARRFIANPAYHALPPLRRLSARDYPELRLTAAEPLYSAFVRTRGAHWPSLTQPRLLAGFQP
jgi:glucose-6-phosphate isomerase